MSSFEERRKQLRIKYGLEKTSSDSTQNAVSLAKTGKGNAASRLPVSASPLQPSYAPNQKYIDDLLDELMSKQKKEKEEKPITEKLGLANSLLHPERRVQQAGMQTVPSGVAQAAASLQQQTEPEKDSRTWFQKGAFEDGYQFGDLTKTVAGSVSDIKENLGSGILGMGEKVVDALAWAAPYFAQGQYYQNGGAYQPVAQQQQFNAMIDQSKQGMGEFIKKDLYDEQKLAKTAADTSLQGIVNKLIGVDSERDSVLGEKSDALVQSAGQLAAQYGLSVVGVPWFVTSGVASFGSEVESALQKGATSEQAGLSGAITAGAEILTEKLFGGDLFVNKAGFDVLTDKITKGIANKFVRKAAQFGLDAAGEGAEEWVSQRIGQFGQWLSYTHDEKGLLQTLYSEDALDEALEAFLGGVALGGSMTGLKAIATQNSPSSATPSATKTATPTMLDQILEASVFGKSKGTSLQPQTAPQSNVNPQTGNGQVSQQTPVESKRTYADELLDSIIAPKQEQGGKQVVREIIDEVLGLGASATADADTVELTQKNTAQASGNKYHLRDYSQQQKDNWRNSKRIVLYEGVEQFKNFIKNALSSKTQTNKKLYFGAVDSDLASAISTETGVNVEGYNLALGENEIRKINKDHGNEQTEAPRGQRAVTEADYLSIPNVVQSPDSIKLSSKLYEGKPVIEFRKTNGNETTVVSAVVSDKRLDLFVQTTYVNKKRGSIATPESEQADSNTPKATGGTAPNNASLGGIRDDSGNRKPYGASSDASINSIPQTTPGVNTNSVESPSQNESVGAAPSGFDPNSHLQYQYGTLPEGKNAVRPDDLPVSTDGTNRVSQTAVTVKGAKVTSDEFADLLTKDVTEKNGMTYIPITNDATVQKAISRITEEGWEVAKERWQADVHNGKAGADLSATGALLLNNAAKAGDKAAWLDILHDYQLLGTNTAQGLQALQILKKLSPSDKLYMAKRSVKKMVEDMELHTEVTIDPELEAEYNAAETDEQRDEVMVKIQKNIAQQLPTTFMEKVNALRYVNMLGNLRTQGRNIVGNLTMKGTRAIHNTIAAGIEAVANKVSGGKTGRTRSVTVSKEQRAAAAKVFDGLQEYILDGGKYNDNTTATGFARGVQEQKQIFKPKLLEGYRKVTNWMMEQGDIIFARDAFARALAGYLKANGIAETDFSKVDPAVMDDACLFAAKEAQEATFRDTNWLSGWVSKVGRRKDTPAPVKVLAEGVMPFRKTPANVLVRAEEYSPLGIVNSVVTSVQKIAGNTELVNKDGVLGKFARGGQEITGTQVINSWAKSLTGTGIFAVGMLLQNLGLLSAGPDEDENKEAFEDLNGWQNYALTLPDGTNLTIDCFSPTAIPMLMGAQLMKEIQENGFELKDIGAALTSIADPLVEMSMLQGVNDALENVRYSDSTLGQLVINSAVSYLTQCLTNTLAGQLERSFEDSRMQTYVDKDSELPAWLQRTLGKASAKIPGWDYSQIPYINAWGEEEENPSAGMSLLYNLLSPSYFDKGRDDDLTRELNRLNGVQSDVNVYPSTPDKSVTVGGKDYNLSADEYVALAKLQGQTQKQIVEDLIASSDYKKLSDQEKISAIRNAYDYARDSARGKVVEGHPGITTKWMQEITGDPAEGIIRHITVDGKYTSLSVSNASYIDDLLDGLLAEKEGGKVRDIQRIEAIAGSKLSEKDQKAVLKEILDGSAFGKFEQVLKARDKKNTYLDTDDYATSYRIYLEEKEIGGKGTKARAIAEFQTELNVSKGVAEKLYDIYSGKK